MTTEKEREEAEVEKEREEAEVEETKQDGQSRIARTTGQVGLPGALLTILAWQLRLHDVDLNPDPELVDMPTEVAGAVIVVLTIALSVLMNLGRLRGNK